MAKLYPPHLDGTVPAFYSDEGKTYFTVPFTPNKTVSKADIKGFALKIKTIQNNELLGVFYQYDISKIEMISDNYVIFNMSGLQLSVGQYYKIQLAFVDETNTVGYYSSTAVVKYTTKPLVQISGLDASNPNNDLVNYVGYYSQKMGDATEKMYSCNFVVRDADGKVIVDSGEIIHRTYNDESNRESHETYTLPEELQDDKPYYMVFTVTTNNKMRVSSPRYRIIKSNTVDPSIDITLKAELCYDEGYINLILHNNTSDQAKKAAGLFSVVRAASNDGYKWRQIGTFNCTSDTTSFGIWKDYTIEHGVTYKYAIQQYNNYGLYSNRIETPSVFADFEDIFLYDGKRQLKVRYNPKVASFKKDIIEQKLDTIGGKYPFIFRNGTVDYHEFSLSGLISYIGDENSEFMQFEKLGLEAPTFNLTGDNIKAERDFKLEVFDWLTNGEAKLFKSPAEGNYIVRLLNVSLSPMDSLGRMLHSFSATAYEVEDLSYENIRKRNFIHINSVPEQTLFKTILLAGHNDDLDLIANSIKQYYMAGLNIQLNESLFIRICNSVYKNSDGEVKNIDIEPYTTESYVLVLDSSRPYGVNALPAELVDAISKLHGSITYAYGQINTEVAYSVDIQHALPGTRVLLDDSEIVIGASGAYYVEVPTGIRKIEIPEEQPWLFNSNVNRQENVTGEVTYSYHGMMANVFDLYTGSKLVDVPAQVWYGPPAAKSYYDFDLKKYVNSRNIIKFIEDAKVSICKIFSIKISRRHVQLIFKKEKDNKYYLDMDCTEVFTEDLYNPTYVYQICHGRPDYQPEDQGKNYRQYVDANFRQGFYLVDNVEYPYATNEVIDGNTKEHFIYTSDFYKYSINSNDEVIAGEYQYSLTDLKDLNIKSIEIGRGLMCEMAYQTKVMDYACETIENSVIKSRRDIYDNYVKLWRMLKERIAELPQEDVVDETKVYVGLREAYDEYRLKVVESYKSLVESVTDYRINYERNLQK